jgi:hypothetical protein
MVCLASTDMRSRQLVVPVVRPLLWTGLLTLTLVMAVLAGRYLLVGEPAYFPDQRTVFLAHQGALYLHISGALLALLAVPLQLAPRVRRRVRLHRAIGRTYLLGCLAGGVGGLALAPFAYGGTVAALGFSGLAVAWLVTGGLGLAGVLRGDFAAHRRWMLRSVSLTLAALTLRVYLSLHQGLGAAGLQLGSFEQAYVAISWVAWVPNLALAWWVTRRRCAPVPTPTAAAQSRMIVCRERRKEGPM